LGSHDFSWFLFAQSQALNKLLVTVCIFLIKIGKQATPLTDKLEEPALGVEIMPVICHMTGKLLDACG
jgi:hypothetical protein